jgi:hypothetical protein
MFGPSRKRQEARNVFLAQTWPHEVGAASIVLIRKGLEKDPSPGMGKRAASRTVMGELRDPAAGIF